MERRAFNHPFTSRLALAAPRNRFTDGVVPPLLVQYEPDSAPALALKATRDRTEARFANYAKAGLLCGNDGLPHLISDPGLALRYNHAGEVFVSVPDLMFACILVIT